jgi:nicotinamide-nucleotide amidase
MQTEIIAIGDEILIGQTVDTNSVFIAKHLNAMGIKVHLKRVIADDNEQIRFALDSLHPQTKLVFMTGGLGPTKDDITKHTLLEYFGGEMVFNQAVYDNVVRLFASFGREPKETNKSQAYLPSSCRAVLNDKGTAPGMHFSQNGIHYFSSPGVPYETEHLVRDKFLPWIEENLAAGKIYHKSLLTQGVPESFLAERLEDWENKLPANVKLAYLPAPGMVRLRLSGYGNTKAESLSLVEAQLPVMRQILGRDVFGEDNQTLPQVVGQLLAEKGLTLSLSESCTGGNIARLITEIAGSSKYFEGGVVNYSNRAKLEIIGVKEKTLAEHGAVAEATIKELAVGARAKFHTDFAVATSGVAGPMGGTAEKPVGMVWIAIASKHRVKAQVFRFGNSRLRNMQRATLMALDMLRREVEKFES